MSELDRFTRAAQESVEELAGIRDSVERDPELLAAALSRSLVLMGSMCLWLRCCAQEALPPAALE